MKKKFVRAALGILSTSAVVLAGCGDDAVQQAVNEANQEAAKATPTTAPAENEGNGGDENGDGGEVSAEPEGLSFADGTVIRMSCGYNNAKTGMRFDAEVAGEGVTLADGVTYHTGDFKPTWVEVQNVLGFTIDDYYAGDADTDNFTKWEAQLADIDMFSGSAQQLQEAGAAGEVVNIADYLDLMPNFKAFLDANPVARMTLTGSVMGDNAGAIYNSPYFDGLDDIEKMPLMRADWVITLLDGDEFTADSSDTTKAFAYQPYMPTSGKVTVDVVKKDGSGVEQVTKDYDAAGNIIDNMNAAGSMSGVEAVAMLREYIDTAYAGYYGDTRSDLFIGQNAAWDADEMVALLRCVCANSASLNADGEKVQGLFSREEGNNARRADLYRLAGILFGVRGLESRQEFLYFDKDGQLHDARGEQATYDALLRMYDLTKEGLISPDFASGNADSKSSTYLEKDLGFMSYDYNQTQTIFNEDGKTLDTAAGEKYMAAMIPVARWDDGNGETFMRFTESWRSAKPGGWAISKPGVGDDQDKLYACLKLIDYAYSPEGYVLMSFGPAAFRDDANTFDFYGKQMPHISAKSYEDLWALAGGNYTNYARQYIGSTLSFNKSQAFEMECTTAVGKEGLGYVTNAISLGTIKHPELSVESNMWYTIVPTVLPTTDADNEQLKSYADLNSNFGTKKVEESNNILINVIATGDTGVDGGAAGAADTVTNSWNGAQYVQIKQTAWEDLKSFSDSNF
ncbi:MAG: hypothetical protein IKI75_10485 [Lachnospiraceae bacterium]|nr:hypothetical protein [Lachnospiraceae bacterium]